MAFWEVIINNTAISIYLIEWIELFGLSINWSLLFDSLTVFMLIPIIYISLFVQLYS